MYTKIFYKIYATGFCEKGFFRPAAIKKCNNLYQSANRWSVKRWWQFLCCLAQKSAENHLFDTIKVWIIRQTRNLQRSGCTIIFSIALITIASYSYSSIRPKSVGHTCHIYMSIIFPFFLTIHWTFLDTSSIPVFQNEIHDAEKPIILQIASYVCCIFSHFYVLEVTSQLKLFANLPQMSRDFHAQRFRCLLPAEAHPRPFGEQRVKREI